MPPEFLLTSFIICLTPGVGVIYTLAATLGGGFRAGFWAAIGCTLATGLHLVVALTGLATILLTSAILFQAVKYAGAAYLLWMAWTILRSGGGMQVTAAEPRPAGKIVLRGITLNILNPKLPLFFIAFLPQFMPAESATAMQMAELGMVFAAITFLTFLLYVLVAVTGRRAILDSPGLMTWMRRAFAASFAALGLQLAMEQSR